MVPRQNMVIELYLLPLVVLSGYRIYIEKICESFGIIDQKTKFPLQLLSWPLSVYKLLDKSLKIKGLNK